MSSNIDKTQTLRSSLFTVNSSSQDLKTEALKKIEKLPKGMAMLISLKGANAGAKYLLDKKTTTIGRDRRSNIFLDDSTVSRNHALILNDDKNYIIKDCKSLNGTYVNLENVAEERQLINEDKINIGKFQLTFFTN